MLASVEVKKEIKTMSAFFKKIYSKTNINRFMMFKWFIG